MTSITVWKMLVTHEDKSKTWEHNHIEEGHSHREFPVHRSQWQKERWNNRNQVLIVSNF